MLSRFLPRWFHVARVRNYPSVPIRDKWDLPSVPGVYYCLRGWEILYIGKANSIRTRWNSYQFGAHHKLEQLLKINDEIGDVDIHYRELPSELIGYIEAVEIQRLNPKLNIRKEKIRDNLNLEVVKLITIKSIKEFVILFLVGFVCAIVFTIIL